MSSGNQPLRGAQLTEYAQEIVDKDPRAALELVLAETTRVRAEADKELTEARAMADVEFGVNGLVPKNLAGIWRLAVMYSKSQMVPTHFRDRPYDCAIVIEMALRCKQNPMAFLQKCYVVHGRPSIESTLAIALANTSGIIKGRITYAFKGEGDARECLAMATLKDSGELITQTVSIKIARSMGWYTKSDSLWPKMPDLMLQYRSAMWLIRAYFPEVLMGVYSTDEVKDMGQGGEMPGELGMFAGTGADALPQDPPLPQETTAKPANKSDALADRLLGAKADKETQPAPTVGKQLPPAETKVAEPDTKPADTGTKTEPAETKTKAQPKEKAAKKKAETPAFTPPTDLEEPVQDVVEEDAAEDRPLTEEEQTEVLKDWAGKNRKCTDCDAVDAELHFQILSRESQFNPSAVEWCRREAGKRKAIILREEKEKPAGGAASPATQQHLLGD